MIEFKGQVKSVTANVAKKTVHVAFDVEDRLLDEDDELKPIDVE